MVSPLTKSNVMHSESHISQIKFDRDYITSSEVMQKLGLSRAALFYARRAGRLPDAIVVNSGQLIIWEREKIKPYIDNMLSRKAA